MRHCASWEELTGRSAFIEVEEFSSRQGMGRQNDDEIAAGPALQAFNKRLNIWPKPTCAFSSVARQGSRQSIPARQHNRRRPTNCDRQVELRKAASDGPERHPLSWIERSVMTLQIGPEARRRGDTCANGKQPDYYVVTSQTDAHPNPWIWTIGRHSKPMGVKISGAGYRSQAAALFAGRRELERFLKLIAQEERRKQ